LKLTGISIQKYRSIKRTPRLNLGNLTVLVGPNNEGKSNVLRALAVSMGLLRRYGYQGTGRATTKLRLYPQEYDWVEDFPKDLQSKTPDGNTIVDLWFELDDAEQADFQRLIGSKLRTELPIRLTIGKGVDFDVRKQGPGRAALTSKAAQIASFIGRSLRVEYVESVRTADRANSIVQDMIEIELEDLRQEDDFASALQTLSSALSPVTERLSGELSSTLKEFLPDVEDVAVVLELDGILEAIAAQARIVVDDGVATELKYKGDGVQSLAALALVRKSVASRRRALLLAIEEPEAHLHPRAVHQLRSVITEIALNQQVVFTTHSPLLVDRAVLANNIIVRSNHATPAKSVADLRDALGVRVGDNLSHASLILLVEGGGDASALNELFTFSSPSLAGALSTGVLAIESLSGSSNLTPRLDALRGQLCQYHVLVDDDVAGRQSVARARGEGLIAPHEENLIIVTGQRESELEDAYNPAVYKAAVLSNFGVDLDVKEFKNGKLKWSDRVEASFRSQGKNWDDRVKLAVKMAVGSQVSLNPGGALHPQRATSVVALMAELERRLAGIDT